MTHKNLLKKIYDDGYTVIEVLGAIVGTQMDVIPTGCNVVMIIALQIQTDHQKIYTYTPKTGWEVR